MSETKELEAPITEVFCLIAKVCIENGAVSIKDVPGCYTLSIGKAFIAVNGHDDKQSAQVPDGGSIDLEPFSAAVFWNGWLIYMGNAFAGTVLMMTEDDLISKIKSLLK